MTVAAWLEVALALGVVVGGGVLLHAWWKARRTLPPIDRPKNGEWPK